MRSDFSLNTNNNEQHQVIIMPGTRTGKNVNTITQSNSVFAGDELYAGLDSRVEVIHNSRFHICTYG